MTRSRLPQYVLVVYIVLCNPFLSWGQWANKPAGLTTVYDCPFSDALCPVIQNVYNTQAYASPGGTPTPLSPPRAFDTFMPVGSNTGNGQWIVYVPHVREIFVGFWWSTNPQFQGIFHSGNKMIFIRGDTDNNFLNWYGPMDSPRTLAWSPQQNGSGMNNCGVPGYDAGGDCSIAGSGGNGIFWPNVNAAVATIAAGSGWHKVEIYQKASTSTTSRDGVIRIWVDGVLSSNYPNVNLAPGGFTDFQINHAWDGGIACGDPNSRDCSREWHHYWDHVHISTGGGSGPTPPTPPSPPPPPPVPPTGIPGTVSDLSAIALSATSIQLSFTAVDDGAGAPAKYDIRHSTAPINWGATPSVVNGTCSTPFAPNVIGPVTCNITGLNPGTAYQSQLVPYRGTLNQGATFSSLSNIASISTPFLPAPVVTTFSPLSGPVGTSVVLTGTAFDATIGNNTVKINGQTATVTAASTTSLTITIPGGASTGRISVQTANGTGFSEQNFVVTVPDAPVIPNTCGCS